MTAGLQCWDENGNLTFDATYRVMRVIGMVEIKNGTPGSVVDDRFLQDGWASFQPSNTAGDAYLSGGIIAPQWQFNGNVLSWSFVPKNSQQFDIYQDGILVYGAY